MRIRKWCYNFSLLRTDEGSLGVLTNGIDKRDRRTDLNERHGFMLFLSCVLSIAAVLFSADFAALNGQFFRDGPANETTQQIEDASAIPPRQQSASLSQTIRAILMEAALAKPQPAYPDGNNHGLPARFAALSFHEAKTAEAVSKPRTFRLFASSKKSPRAPPASV